jgi:hypothetical protein
MAYERQNFKNDQILDADQLNHIEDGIIELEESLKNVSPDQDLSGYAKKNQGVYFIVGDSKSTEGEWIGSHPDITEYVEGMIIAYQIPVDGGSSSTYININNLGRTPVYRNRLTSLKKEYLVGATLFLVYTFYNKKYAWRIADYDSNTNTVNTVGICESPDTRLYLAGSKTTGEETKNNDVSYTNPNVYIETDNCLYSNGEKVATQTQVNNELSKLSLGIHTDGALYIFIDGVPVGTGIILNGMLGTTEGFIDVDNNIFLPDNFVSGTYTLKYENEDNTYTTIGQFDIPEEDE